MVGRAYGLLTGFPLEHPLVVSQRVVDNLAAAHQAPTWGPTYSAHHRKAFSRFKHARALSWPDLVYLGDLREPIDKSLSR